MTLRLEKIAPRDDIVYGRTKPPPSPSAGYTARSCTAEVHQTKIQEDHC